MEVQFDEHKLLVVYAHDLGPFERILLQHGVVRDDGLQLITEGEHLHSTAPALRGGVRAAVLPRRRRRAGRARQLGINEHEPERRESSTKNSIGSCCFPFVSFRVSVVLFSTLTAAANP